MDYNGHLSIVLNDHQPRVVLRNTLILYVLLEIEDKFLAAEIALHLWYSTFMPVEYEARILSAATATRIKSKNHSNTTSPESGATESTRLIANFSDAMELDFASIREQMQARVPDHASAAKGFSAETWVVFFFHVTLHDDFLGSFLFELITIIAISANSNRPIVSQWRFTEKLVSFYPLARQLSTSTSLTRPFLRKLETGFRVIEFLLSKAGSEYKSVRAYSS